MIFCLNDVHVCPVAADVAVTTVLSSVLSSLINTLRKVIQSNLPFQSE